MQPDHASGPIVITGGTDGIGKALANHLLPTGIPLILIGRNQDKGDAVVADLQRMNSTSQVRFWSYDLARMHQVQALADRLIAEEPPLVGVVHTAGTMLPRRTLTTEGLETVFAVQYLARFALTAALREHLCPSAHIVTVSAAGTIPLRLRWGNLQGEHFYSGIFALIHESVANDLWTLAAIHQYPNLLFYNYGPFLVTSSLFQLMPAAFRVVTWVASPFWGITPAVAAHDIFRLLTEHHPSGLYRRQLQPTTPSRYLTNAANQERLWRISVAMVSTVQ